MDEMNQPSPGPVPGAPRDYLQPAFWAGVCSGVLTGVPGLSLLFCLWMTGG